MDSGAVYEIDLSHAWKKYAVYPSSHASLLDLLQCHLLLYSIAVFLTRSVAFNAVCQAAQRNCSKSTGFNLYALQPCALSFELGCLLRCAVHSCAVHSCAVLCCAVLCCVTTSTTAKLISPYLFFFSSSQPPLSHRQHLRSSPAPQPLLKPPTPWRFFVSLAGSMISCWTSSVAQKKGHKPSSSTPNTRSHSWFSSTLCSRSTQQPTGACLSTTA